MKKCIIYDELAPITLEWWDSLSKILDIKREKIMSNRNIRVTGKVVRVVTDKGFGFISPDDSNDDYFFHADSMTERAKFGKNLINQRVEFTPTSGHKGPRAEDVVLI